MVPASLLVLILALPQDGLRDLPPATRADLDELKTLVLKDLRSPRPLQLANGLKDSYRLRSRLELICGWTETEFVEPLLDILDKEEAERIHAAACLMRYGRPDIDRKVALHAKHRGYLGSGCIVSEVVVGDMVDEYRKAGKLPNMLRAGNLSANVVALQNGAPLERQEAWLALATREWFAPWQEYRLDPVALWRALQKGDASRVLRTPIMGAHRATTFLAAVRSATQDAREIDLLTAQRWRLGCDDEGPASRAILLAHLEALSQNSDPDYQSYRPLWDLCARPVFENFDLYRRLIARPSESLRYLGWRAIIALDRKESLDLFRACWKEPGKELLSDAAEMFKGVAQLGERMSSSREEWIDALLVIESVIPTYAKAHWITAVSSLAARDFGHNGLYMPGGFHEPSARPTLNAIHEWAAQRAGAQKR